MELEAVAGGSQTKGSLAPVGWGPDSSVIGGAGATLASSAVGSIVTGTAGATAVVSSNNQGAVASALGKCELRNQGAAGHAASS